MIPFTKFSYLKRKFVALQLDNSSVQAMHQWCVQNGFDITKDFEGKPCKNFDFHITVFFTSNEVDLNNVEIPISRIPIVFEDIHLFGEDKNIPVLTVQPNKYLLGIREMFERKGLEDNFPVWRPHVSVSYNYNGSPNISEVKLPYSNMYVDKIIIKDQKQ